MEFLLIFSVLMICIVFTGIDACKNCTQNDFMNVQVTCKDAIQKLNDEQHAFSTKNESQICTQLFNFYFCVGDHVPACLGKITAGYSNFYSSPYDCHPPLEVTYKLQDYINEGCKMTPQKEIETTVQYDVITTPSSPSQGGITNHLNSTNEAIPNKVQLKTFLCMVTSLVSWYLDVL